MDYQTQLRQRLEILRSDIDAAAQRSGRAADAITLIAVTKNHPLNTVLAIIDCGITNIGENRVQELVAKVPHLQGAVTVHMIGHLQRNKARKAVQHAHWIQSLDSPRLIEAVQEYAAELDKVINVMVEVNTSAEAAKSGCPPQDTLALCEQIGACTNLRLRGLMTVGPLSDDERVVRTAFSLLRQLAAAAAPLCSGGVCELSMGMSSDFVWAIEEGATIVRIGTALVGARTL